MWCKHHWHTIKESFRKIKSDQGPICKLEKDRPEYLYVSIGSCGMREIKIAHIEMCCFCGKQKITSYRMSVYRGCVTTIGIMNYPDIEDSPLKLPYSCKKIKEMEKTHV